MIIMNSFENKDLTSTQHEIGGLASSTDSNKEIKSWIITIGVAAVVVLAVFLYRTNKAGNEEKASRMLGEARNAQALQAIMNQYPSSSAARMALLQMAKAQFDNGDYISSQASYKDFLSKFPSHPMSGIAELGLIHCTEASGQTEKALDEYTRFASTKATHFLAPTAIFGKARCLQALKRYDKARATYDDFLAANPKSDWKNDIEEALKQLEREARTPLIKL
jgi:outer membrane protein assembly factor BamD (BamD/ComL family)